MLVQTWRPVARGPVVFPAALGRSQAQPSASQQWVLVRADRPRQKLPESSLLGVRHGVPVLPFAIHAQG